VDLTGASWQKSSGPDLHPAEWEAFTLGVQDGEFDLA
jgi:hypothetical protein